MIVGQHESSVANAIVASLRIDAGRMSSTDFRILRALVYVVTS